MKTNKQRVEEKLNRELFTIGCWDNNINKLNYNNIKKVLDDIPFGSTDIQVFYKKRTYIIEVSDVDNEYDFKMTSVSAYRSKYGDEYDEKFNW